MPQTIELGTNIPRKFLMHLVARGSAVDNASHSASQGAVAVRLGDTITIAVDMDSRNVAGIVNGCERSTMRLPVDVGAVIPVLGLGKGGAVRLNLGSRALAVLELQRTRVRTVQQHIWHVQRSTMKSLAGDRAGAIEAISGKGCVTIAGNRVTPRISFPTLVLSGTLLTHGRWFYEVPYGLDGRFE